MNKIKKVFQWIVYSSANARALSVTVRAIGIGLIPSAIYFLNLAHVQFDNIALTVLVDQIAQFILQLGTAITLIVGAFGLIRKIGTTATGENQVVNSWQYEDQG